MLAGSVESISILLAVRAFQLTLYNHMLRIHYKANILLVTDELAAITRWDFLDNYDLWDQLFSFDKRYTNSF